MKRDLQRFFYPKSICVVGASGKEKSIGYELLKNIKSYFYKGKLTAVNPKTKEILGVKCFPSISDIDFEIDLAIVVVPKQFVLDTVKELKKKNVKSIILITAGFREIGGDGAVLESNLLELIRENELSLIGPNCMGIINSLPSVKLNATFVAEQPMTGNSAFLSQSGALGAAVLNSLRTTDISFAHFVSVGNKADLNENDFVQYWQTDPNIKIISLYLESFENGFEFIKNNLSDSTKPIIVLKAGKTTSGMHAASSHTGALSTEDRVVDSVLKQFGVIRVSDLNEMFNTVKGFENFPIPKSNRVAVVTNAGGPAILSVDKLDAAGLQLAKFSAETTGKLREIVHPEGSVKNPVDLLPGGTAENYRRTIEIILNDENVDAVISIFVEPVMVNPMDVVSEVYSINSPKPIYQVAMPRPEFWSEYNSLENSKPVFRNPEDPAVMISNLVRVNEWEKKLQKNKNEYFQNLKNYNTTGIYSENEFLTASEVNLLLKKYDLPIVESFTFGQNEIENAEFNFPLVLKGISSKVIHKTEFNAVYVNLKSKDEMIAAAKKIADSFAENEIEEFEFMVQPYIEPKFELLIGGRRDRSFEPVVMFGGGGKYVEIYNDTSIRSAILCDADIGELINETHIGKILHGTRGEKPIDIEMLTTIIRSSAQMLSENKNLVEFDFNPMIVGSDDSFHIVDARVRLG